MQPNARLTASREDKILLLKLLEKYITYWPFFIIAFILNTSIAIVYLRYASPKFEATASIIIKDEKKGYEDSKLIEALDIVNTKKIIENETEILQSRAVITEVVKNLHQYAPIFYIGKIHARSAYRESPVYLEIENPDTIKNYSSKIVFSYNKKKRGVQLGHSNFLPLAQWYNSPNGRIRFMPDSNYRRGNNTKQFYCLIKPPSTIVGSILANLKVTATNKLSSVINLKYVDDTPLLAEDILKGIINAYNMLSIKEKNIRAMHTLTFIEDRLHLVGTDLDVVEHNIQQLKSDSLSYANSIEGELYLQNIHSNYQQLNALKIELDLMNVMENQFAKKDTTLLAYAAASQLPDPVLTMLINQLQSAITAVENLSKTVASNNPVLVTRVQEVAAVKKQIINLIQQRKFKLNNDLKNIRTNNNTFSKSLASIPLKDEKLLAVSRDYEIKSSIYSFLLQKREEIELSYASTLSDSRVINEAQGDKSPVSPNKMIIIVITVVSILAMPLVLIVIKESLHATFHYGEEITAITILPILSEIPFFKVKSQMNEGTQFVLGKECKNEMNIVEAFRALRLMLMKMIDARIGTTILIVSTTADEGKHFIGSQLASSYAMTDKKVLLIDADFYQNSSQNNEQAFENQGLVQFLLGECEATLIIHPSPIYKNVWLISTGTLTQHTPELIENQRMETLMQLLKAHFDIIFIVSSALDHAADAQLLSKWCQLSLYIIRYKKSLKKKFKKYMHSQLFQHLPMPCIVFNAIKR